MKKFILVIVLTLLFSGCSPLYFPREKLNPPKLPQYSKIETALVLGGGGSKGLAHVGVIEELEKANIKPDIIIGCSAGAIVGALYADTKDISHVKKLLLTASRDEFLDFSFYTFPHGLVKGKSLKRFLKKHLHAQSFKQLKIPFIATTTNLQHGHLTPFGHGKLTPAIAASAAYPGLFHPVRINQQYYVDGGVANPIPVEVARQLGAKRVIAVDIGELLTEHPPRHLFGVLKRSLEISYIHQSKLAVETADIIIKVPFVDVGTFNDQENQTLYLMGKKAARDVLSRLPTSTPMS